MGIYDRDYYRNDSRGLFDGLGRWGACVWIIVITCAAFLAQLVTQDAAMRGGVTELGIYDPVLIARGQVWRLLTAVFLHSPFSLFHIAFNMLVLYWVGSRMEAVYGGREFLGFYLTAGVFANCVNFTAWAAGLVPGNPSYGASGAVTAVLVLYACHFPRQTVLLFFVLPMPMWALAVVYVAIDAFGVMGVGRDGIGYLVHLGGAVFGLIYFVTGVRLTNWSLPLPARAPAARRPHLRVHSPDPSDSDTPPLPAVAVPEPPRPAPTDEYLEARLDHVLEKVSKYGQESLTAEERAILFRASEVYKRRRK